MKNTYQYMPFYAEEYLIESGYLRTVEHGAYLLLIIRYWTTAAPLPADDEILSDIVKMPLCEWMLVKPRIMKFFSLEGGAWRHQRIEDTLAANRAITAKKRAVANKRWDRAERVVVPLRQHEDPDMPF